MAKQVLIAIFTTGTILTNSSGKRNSAKVQWMVKQLDTYPTSSKSALSV